MPRVVVDPDGGPSALGHLDPILLPHGEVVDELEVPIATEMGVVPDIDSALLASLLDPYAPAPATPNDQEGHNNATD